MSFVTALALAIAALVVAPVIAHRLRRKRAEPHPFAAARLVPATRPKARRRARLEDRTLFALRALSILALALLGASPLVRCTRLSMSRSGASLAIAIVLDDSMSMRAPSPDGRPRFAKAREGAQQIVASLHEGDAVAIVLAGAPARVALAATTDLGAARTALDQLEPSDRATDLDGAIATGGTLVGALPQVDRRVVVLSDLADGRPDGPPIGEGSAVPVWVAMPELAAPVDDCALLGADRAGVHVRVRFACSGVGAATGREVRVKSGDDVLGAAPLAPTLRGEVLVPAKPGPDGAEVFAELTGKDAVASDDRALVLIESGPSSIGFVADRGELSAATGGASVLEQALGALGLEMTARSLPQVPDQVEDLAAFAALVVDDPPGLTPEQRRAVTTFAERGGVVLLTLGARAASAPLGATVDPFVTRPFTWSREAPAGADVAAAAPVLGESALSLAEFSPRGRARIADEDAAEMDGVVRWSDGALLFGRRTRGRGELWLSTMPLSLDLSDLTLRPGFLALLDAFAAAARERAVPRRGEVGAPWKLAGAREVSWDGPGGKGEPARGPDGLTAAPSLVGVYKLRVDGASELRVAAPVVREVDTRPRAVAPAASALSHGGARATVDISWVVALVLLALVACELVVRSLTARPAEEV